MTKLTLLILGLVVLTGTVLMVSAAPDAARSTSAQPTMDIRALERSMDLNALPKNDLDPAVYQ